jgi:hypothetical protein
MREPSGGAEETFGVLKWPKEGCLVLGFQRSLVRITPKTTDVVMIL